MSLFKRTGREFPHPDTGEVVYELERTEPPRQAMVWQRDPVVVYKDDYGDEFAVNTHNMLIAKTTRNASGGWNIHILDAHGGLMNAAGWFRSEDTAHSVLRGMR